MLACFRKDGAFDPETYSSAMAAVLDDYSDDLVIMATDPRTGIPSRLNWPPTVKELRDFCDEIVERQNRNAEREREFRKQISLRSEFDAPRTPEEIARVMAMAQEAREALSVDSARPSSDEVHRKQHEAETRWLERDYEKAGFMPRLLPDGRPISLGLLRQLEGKEA